MNSVRGIQETVASPPVPGGVVHKLPGYLRKALIANPTALAAWNDMTPLARNEFICWVEDAKQEMTRVSGFAAFYSGGTKRSHSRP